jgi:hypothetical protein
VTPKDKPIPVDEKQIASSIAESRALIDVRQAVFTVNAVSGEQGAEVDAEKAPSSATVVFDAEKSPVNSSASATSSVALERKSSASVVVECTVCGATRFLTSCPKPNCTFISCAQCMQHVRKHFKRHAPKPQ